MGKKGDKGEEEAATGLNLTEIMALKAHIQQVEEMMQAQFLQLKSELRSDMTSSQIKMKRETKDQLEEFFHRFMRLQSGVPPPQTSTAEAAASNLGQLSNRQLVVGEHSPLSQGFLVSPIPHMQLSKPGPSTPHRPNPTNPPRTTITTKISSPETPQIGMPTSLWPGVTQSVPFSTSAPSLTFQLQILATPPPHPTIPSFSTYTSYCPSYTNPAYQNLPPYNTIPAFSQPIPPYPQSPSHYYSSYPNPANTC
jgi:hypothetical protein